MGIENAPLFGHKNRDDCLLCATLSAGAGLHSGPEISPAHTANGNDLHSQTATIANSE